jgi:hypothetical protein
VVCVGRRLRLGPAHPRPGCGGRGGAGAAARRSLLLRRPASTTSGQGRPAAPPRRQVRLRRPGDLAGPDRHPNLPGRPVRHRDRAGMERAASQAAAPPGHGSGGPRPIVRGTIIRVQVERVPAKTRPPKVLWLWWAGPADLQLDLDLAWRASIRRFDCEHTVRFCKQTLGWTIPRPRHPEQADRWTWLVLAGYAQLRLARAVVCDQRLPWERPRPSRDCHPVGCGAGFHDCWSHSPRRPPRQNPQGAPQAGPGQPLRTRHPLPGHQQARHQAQEESHQDRQGRLTAPQPAPYDRRQGQRLARHAPG